jgi:hypothetical protein
LSATSLFGDSFSELERWGRVDNLGLGKKRAGKADVLLGATEAGSARSHRPAADHVVEVQGRTVVICFRPLTSQLVQTVSAPVTFVAEGVGKATGVKMGSAFTVFVNEAAVGELGPAFVVQGGQGMEGEEMNDRGEKL